MNITWHGFSSFEVQTKMAGVDVSIVTDPYDNALGLRFPRTLESDIVTVSHDGKDASNKGAIGGTPFIIDMAGEYEVKNVFIFQKDAPTKAGANRITLIESENMSIGHLGALDRELKDSELKMLKDVDILMVPVGGGNVLDGKTAAAVVGQVEPRVVIPMSYHVDGVKEKLAGIEDFKKNLGARSEEANKYKVARKDLPDEDMLMMVLAR